MESSHFAAGPSGEGKSRRGHATAWLIILYWVSQFGFLTAQRNLMAMDKPDDITFILPRISVAIAGMLISFGIARLQRKLGRQSWTRRLLISLAAAVVAAFIHSGTNFLAFQIAMPDRNMESISVATYVGATVQWLWTYVAISALLLAAIYSEELRERERRMAELQGLAQEAQIRSLRYQLNPHFMFNTLNSVAALIAAGEGTRAEQMVETLADFLRAGLALDPSDDLTLARELELQSLYLSIESVRFADRLAIRTSLPPELGDVLVPSLILQPIVENAVKHGVARNSGCTCIDIDARQQGERLVITVSNGIAAPDVARARAGTGVGLVNVARRLELRYGQDCAFSAGLDEDRLYVVSLSLPLRRRP